MRVPEAIGPYQVVRQLGRGAMGVVFEVRHPEVARPLALKFLPDLFADEQGKARFARETELLARVRHRNVLPVHDAGDSPEGPWLVTELIPGQDLKQVVEGRGPLPGREAARVVAELAEGVAALHAQGILHRDLKPGNVLLRPEGTPIIIDFGLARAGDVERLTRTGDFLGTPAYMAPEQASGKPEPRSDVYALGAILYHLLTGRAPFVGKSALDVFKAIFKDDPPHPEGLGVEVDPGLWAVCRRALDKDPERRPPSAAGLRDELRRWTVTTHAAPSPARRPLRVAALALAVLVLAAAGLLLRARSGEPPREGGAAPGGPPRLEIAPVATLTWDLALRLELVVRGAGPLKLFLPGRPLPDRVHDGDHLTREVELAVGTNRLPLRLEGGASPPAEAELVVTRVAAPAWLREPGPRPRPALPFPAGLEPDERAGVYVWSGRTVVHELVWVPPGPAPGPTSGEQGPSLLGFFLGRTEVTRDQYRRYCAQTGAAMPELASGQALPPELPAFGIGWSEAQDYCQYLGLRLPTPAEWARAACGDDDRRYPWGRSLPGPDRPLANVPGAGQGQPGPAPVGSFPEVEGPFGALDLVGNVAEWVGPQEVRGGAFVLPSTGNPPPLEVFLDPRTSFHIEPGGRRPWIGFRVALSATPAR